MLKGLITLHEDVLVLVNAYQAVTQPVLDFLLGWLFRWLDWPFPWWAKDYLTMSVVVAAASTRSSLLVMREGYRNVSPSFRLLSTFFASLFWPLELLGNSVMLLSRPGYRPYLGTFFEFIFWTLIIIATSYGLFWMKG